MRTVYAVLKLYYEALIFQLSDPYEAKSHPFKEAIRRICVFTACPISRPVSGDFSVCHYQNCKAVNGTPLGRISFINSVS